MAAFSRTAALLLLVSCLGASASPSQPSCRCYPGNECWPAPEEWTALNASLSGALIATTPIGSVCHTNSPYTPYNSQECSSLLANWADPEIHYEDPSSPMAAWFTNFSCSPFYPPSDPCTIGPLVQYTVNVTSSASVQRTLQFSRTHNLRLVVRNTGHDYMGKSTGAGAVALWTHHLKDIEYVSYARPWYTGAAMRLGAGVQGFEAQDAAHALGLTVVTGNCPSVGIAGGYTQGGGHGQLASRFGLGADQVLEWEVVTAAGETLTASPAQNADLFWALSGGGGGTFAVVVGMTVRAYREEITASGTLEVAMVSDDERFWRFLRTFLTDTLRLSDAGGVVIWELAATSEDTLGFRAVPMTLPGGTREELDGYFSSALLMLQRFNISYRYEVDTYPSFHTSYAATTPEMNVTEYHLGGHLIPKSTIQSNPDGLLSAFQRILQHNAVISGVSLNVSLPLPNNNIPNAVNPVWREIALSTVIGTPFNFTNRQTNIDHQRLMTEVLVPELEALTPPSERAAYLNEADWNQPDWKSAFYGANYDRLLQVKDKYDPHQVFYGRTAVGSERWAEGEDGRLCRVR